VFEGIAGRWLLGDCDLDGLKACTIAFMKFGGEESLKPALLQLRSKQEGHSPGSPVTAINHWAGENEAWPP
jgi:hypothetical protein